MGIIRIGYEARDTELYFYVKDTGGNSGRKGMFERFLVHIAVGACKPLTETGKGKVETSLSMTVN